MADPAGIRVADGTVRVTARVGGSLTIRDFPRQAGDLCGFSGVHVEGTIKLEKHDLTIGVSGTAHANLTAKLVRIEGEVVGDVVGIERVVIASSGRVRGNITAPRVLVEDGARFKGMIDMDFADKSTEKGHRNGGVIENAVSRAAAS